MIKLVPTSVVDICPSPYGYAVFMKADKKVFVIYVDRSRGMAMQNAFTCHKAERPLSHEFMLHTLDALDCELKSVLIYREENGTYFTMMKVAMENELGSKIAEIDGRPSDTIAVALAANAPIFIRSDVLKNLADMNEALKKIKGE